jgi:hypothetical protein
MGLKFLKFVLLIFAFLGFWTLVLALVSILLLEIGDVAIILGSFGFVVIIAITLIPYINAIAKRVMFFPGNGSVPVSQENLQTALEQLIDSGSPIFLKKYKGKFLFSWNYLDEKWQRLLYRSRKQAWYELQLRFYEQDKTVFLTDKQKELTWEIDVGQSFLKAKIRASWFLGISFEKIQGIRFNEREPNSLKWTKEQKYSFTSLEIKNPVINLILSSGWDVRFALW